MTLCNTIDYCMQKKFDEASFDHVLVDLQETQGIDSTTLGLLAKLSIKAKKRTGQVPTVVSPNPDITRTMLSMGFDESVFEIIRQPTPEFEDLSEIPQLQVSEDGIRDKVIEAHKILMSLNDNNKDIFNDLVKELERSDI